MDRPLKHAPQSNPKERINANQDDPAEIFFPALTSTDTPPNRSREAVRQSNDGNAQKRPTPQVNFNSLNVLEQLPFGTIICNSQNIILFANQHFQEFLESAGKTCVGKPLQALMSPVHATDRLPHISQFTQSGSSTLETELTVITAEKATKHVLIKAVLLHNENSQADKILMQVVDMTRKKETEALLEGRSADLEKFVYSTSHDLRAPLRSILGLIYIMQQESSPEAIKTYLDMIRSSVNRMDNFIKEMVDLSRNSRQPVNKEEINLHEVVTQIFDSLRFIPEAEKIELSVNIEQEKPLISDAGRLKVILNNLISNAITYHRLNQQKPFIQVKACIQGQYCQIEVIDNGRGIQKEHQAKIFDMFYRASEDSKGSGLGLYIVKEAVQKLNGEIRIHSKWGEGSTFCIRLFNHYR